MGAKNKATRLLHIKLYLYYYRNLKINDSYLSCLSSSLSFIIIIIKKVTLKQQPLNIKFLNILKNIKNVFIFYKVSQLNIKLFFFSCHLMFLAPLC